MQPLTMRDAVSLHGVRALADGRLVAEPRFARVGIQIYGGQEVGRPDQPVVRLYRSPEAVFDQAAMASFCHRAITNDHPPAGVTTDNFRDLVVGFTGEQVTKDGDFVRVPMLLADAGTIQDIRDGKVELSAGYTCDVDWTPGIAPNGEPFDGEMKNIRGNHIAIVDRARAGSECRIGDGTKPVVAPVTPPTPSTTQGGPSAMADESSRAVLLDGLTIRTNDAGAEAIARLQRQLADAAQATEAANARIREAEAAHTAALQARDGQIAALTATHTEALQAKDGEIAGLTAAHTAALAEKDGQIAALTAQVSDEALEARATARAALVGDARRILGDGYQPAGKSDAQIRKDVAVKVLGAALTDADSQPAAFFDGVFKAALQKAPAAAPKGADPLAAGIAAGGGTLAADAANQQPRAWERNRARIEGAWRHDTGKEAV